MTQIQWTDETWNPVTGCAKVSPGCAHCYAEGVANRFWETQYPKIEFCAEQPSRPRRFTDVWTHPDRLRQPFSWKKPRRVFVNSMSDLFHDDVPPDFIADVMAVCAATPQHTYQILTKRPARMLELFRDPPAGAQWPLQNVWLGVSVENQRFANERIPLLMQTPAAVRFISAEPLLGEVDLSDFLPVQTIGGVEMETWLDWVIVGGESGRKVRPCCLSWIRNIVHDCQSADVPVFVKQLGARPYETTEDDGSDGECRWPIGFELQLRDRKGGDPSEWPYDLRVREFPA